MDNQIIFSSSNFDLPFKGYFFDVKAITITRQNSDDNRYSIMIDIIGYENKIAREISDYVDVRRYQTPLTNIEMQAGDDFMVKVNAWVMQQPDMVNSTAI